jgi:PE family
MSYLIAAPELMTSATTDLATIGANVGAAHMAAARPDPRGAARGTRQIDMGMDPWDFKPVSLDTLVALVEVLEGVSAPTVLRS